MKIGYTSDYDYPLKGAVFTCKDGSKQFVEHNCSFETWLDYACELAIKNAMAKVDEMLVFENDLDFYKRYGMLPYRHNLINKICLNNV